MMRVMCVLLLIPSLFAAAQAPTPNTSGLPSGVTHPLSIEDDHIQPNPQLNPKTAPLIPGILPTPTAPLAQGNGIAAAVVVPGLIGPGDVLDISEAHTPEFRSTVRVADDSTVMLPLIGQVNLQRLDERRAAAAIETALVDQGMLKHPRVTVLVTVAVGQDITVLGEVAHPGVYPFTPHHRLLDLLSSSSGLTRTAGRLVTIYHRDDPYTPHPVMLNPEGISLGRIGKGLVPAGTKQVVTDTNPELAVGDTVVVSRAGLVYVVGDVTRPGGFPIDPVRGLTIVQALSLAWGTTQNAATKRALLIREQDGGRTLTTLNVSRMMRGLDPDQPIYDRDILFIPDSAAKAVLNRTLESAIQSALGVSIYAGLVYSQRF